MCMCVFYVCCDWPTADVLATTSVGLGAPSCCWSAADAMSDTTEDDDDASHASGRLVRQQERFRRLFGVFDANQDGFLDK